MLSHVVAKGANAFSTQFFPSGAAVKTVTIKETRPPEQLVSVFNGCDALETINVSRWTSGAYLHAKGWSTLGAAFVEPNPQPLWAEGHRIAADKQVGVCSWTWHADMETVLKEMQADGRYNGVQLALAPWLGIGAQEADGAWELITNKVASGEFNVMATMINFPGEDYTTLVSITNTQGYMNGVATNSPAAEAWAANLRYTEEAARLTKELGGDTLTTEAGFIYVNQNLMFERMSNVCDVCSSYGVQILIESGPQHSLFMTNLLERLNKEGYTNVGVNYDPSDTQLFGSEVSETHLGPTCTFRSRS